MKKIFSLMLVLSLVLTILPVTLPAYAAGTGTAQDPFIITNASEFNAIRNNPKAYYVLNADIVLDDSYVPFEFSGSLVGANEETPYSISVNISGVSSYTAPLGLFTVINGAELRNLALKGKVSGIAYVGGFFGRTSEAEANSDGISAGEKSVKLENLINYASVTGSGSYVGGIAGAVSDGALINKLTNSGAVKAKSFVGGVFASFYDGTNLINNGYVYSSGDYAGGIAAEQKGEITNAYNNGFVSANSYSGGITGAASGKDITLINTANYGMVEGRASSLLNLCGGILGGIKRLADVNAIIKNSLDTGSVSSMNFIHSQYLSYDATNIITVENSYYLSDTDIELAGAKPFESDYISDILKKLDGFATVSENQYPMVKGLPFLSYVQPPVEEVKKEEVIKEKTEATKEAGLLYTLNVIDSIDNTDVNVTRGEFADLVSRAFLYNQKYLQSAAEPAFSDVDTTYGYYDSVKVITDLKIMGAISYNRFYPDKEITLSEAVTALVRATGYELYAKANGGYPTGYLYEAKLRNILNGIEASSTQNITLETAIKLVYNSLFVNPAEINGVTDDGNVLTINGSVKYINQIHDVYEYDVVLTDNGAVDKENIIFGTNMVEITDFNTNATKIVKATDSALPLFGVRIKAFVREDGVNKDELIYHVVNKDTKIEQIEGKNVLSMTESLITYEKNPEEGKSYKVKLNTTDTPLVYINGKRSKNYKASDFKSKTAVIFAIDNNSDGYYERINIFDYDYDVIAGTITENNTIYALTGSVYNFVINPEKVAIAFVYGSEITRVSDIKANDVISVAKSTVTKNGDPLYYINISRDTKEGKVITIDTENVYLEDGEFVISELLKNTYFNYKNSAKSGETVTLYFNYAGEVSYIYNGVATGRTYGFVLDAGLIGNFEPYGIVKMLTESGEVKSIRVAEKVKREDVSVTNLSSFVDELKASNDNLISYQLNADGELFNVIYPKYPTNNEVENIDNFTLRKEIISSTRSTGIVLGGIGVNNTIVFRVPMDYDKNGLDSRVGKNLFVNKEYYDNVKIYDVEQNGVAKAALDRPATSSTSFNSKPSSGCLFVKTVGGYHEDIGPMQKIYFYDKGVEKSAFVNSDVKLLASTNITINSLSELKPGDYFFYELDNFGNVNKIQVIYKADSFGTSADGIIYRGGDGTTETNFMTIVLLEGTVQYKSNNSLTLRLPGEDYKVEPFSYSPTSLVIYKINRTKGTISFISDAEIEVSNFAAGTTGDRIFTVSNKNTLQEVVIYE